MEHVLGCLIFIAAQIDNTEVIQDIVARRTQRRDVTSSERSFTVRFWDYSRKPSNRTPRNSLKTLNRKISTREKFRFSHFACVSLLGHGRGACPAPSLQHPATRKPTLADGHTLPPCFRASLPLSGVTLGDGHTVPSKIAVTPAPSAKVRNLMDTLYGLFSAAEGDVKVLL